jgi:cob(I)alamin adenosyltransferase
MKLYTGRGDQGGTDLLGERVEKDDPRIELIGDLDESSSSMGLARALALRDETKDIVIEVQRDLYRIMAELAFTSDVHPEGYTIGADRVERISWLTDQLSEAIELPRQFIVPGDTVAGASLDVARTVVRRAERKAVTLLRQGHIENGEILRYVNRLSSLLFMLARAEDAVTGAAPLVAKSGTRTEIA